MSQSNQNANRSPSDTSPRRVVITAGPTHEPIDAVRFIGNRSSGRLGLALAAETRRRGWNTTLLLGPVAMSAVDSDVRLRRFQTTADLQALLEEEVPGADLLVMAAAVADYRPAASETDLSGKRRRTGDAMVLSLEPTPDLLAGCRRLRRDGQVFVGFALEPEADLMASAERKLKRKGVDLIVANPLETMDAPTIDATLIGHAGVLAETDGRIDKADFGAWLMRHVESNWSSLVRAAPTA